MLNSKQVDAIIWLQTGFLGDIILTTAGMKLAQEIFPQVPQYLLTTPIGKAALGDFSLLTKIFTLNKSLPWYQTFWQIKKEIGYELAKKKLVNPIILQTHRSFRSSLLAFILQPKVATYYESSFGFLAAFHCHRIIPWHEAHRIAALLQNVGVDREFILKARPWLSKSEKNKCASFEKLSQDNSHNIIAIAPGSVWATKRWPTEYFDGLIAKILSTTDFRIVLLGSKAEQPLAKLMRTEHFSSGRVLDLMGQTELKELPYIFARLKAIVCNDSSLLHYASAFDVPTLAIFGATTPALGFGPLASKNLIAENLLTAPCRPCGLHGSHNCPLGHFKCMQDLSPELVFAQFMELINGVDKSE